MLEACYDSLPIQSLKINIEIKIADDGPDYDINFDQSGDRKFEATVSPSAILNQKEASDKGKPATKATIKDGKLELSASDDNAGVLRIEYSLDKGETWMDYQKPLDIEAKSSDIRYRAIDRVGNVEKIKEFK